VQVLLLLLQEFFVDHHWYSQQNFSHRVQFVVYIKRKKLNPKKKMQIRKSTLRLMIVMILFCLLYVLNDFPMLLIDYLEPKIENNKIFFVHNPLTRDKSGRSVRSKPDV